MIGKAIFRIFLLITMMGVSIAIYAQDKVVVVPLAGDDAYQIKSGQTLTGVMVFITEQESNEFSYLTLSFASPLPPGSPQPQIEKGLSADCPGVGSAASGILCLYPTSEINVGGISYSSNNTVESRQFGFILFMVRSDVDEPGYGFYAWAYGVP